MNEQAKQLGALDLRRVLMLSQLMGYSIDGMKGTPMFTGRMGADFKNMENCIGRMKASIRQYDTKHNASAIQADLTDDRLHTVFEIMDELLDIKNIDDVLELLRQAKQPLQTK